MSFAVIWFCHSGDATVVWVGTPDAVVHALMRTPSKASTETLQYL